jgi:drug/metabolite transporter (DMT)-like permease
MSARHQLQLKLAPWALLSVSASWGFAFVVMKDAIERQTVNNFLFSRFVVAVAVMILIRPQCIKYFNKDLLVRATIAGLFLGTGYILQTLGLKLTGAAITGFITGLYVVFTPLIAAIVLKARITLITWGCVGVATLGLALLSLQGWSIGFGELLVLGSAFAFGAHIIALGKWSSGRDAYAMTVVQLAVCAIMTGFASIFEGGYQLPPDNGVWATVIFTAVVCTAVAFVIQTWSQAHMGTTKVAVILTMEVVFAAFFAMFDKLTCRRRTKLSS